MKSARCKLTVVAQIALAAVFLVIQTPPASSNEIGGIPHNNGAPNVQGERIPPRPEEKPPAGERIQPWQLIRKLQHLQDAIVAGIPGSLNIYRKLLVKYSGLMLGQKADVWSSQKNLNAAAIYVLIGGNPAVGIKAVEVSTLDDLAKRPLIAAIAYAERNFAEARQLMLALDHRLIQPSAAAQFALAKSMVTASTDLKLASMYLNEARRLAPGTLIEEAALRRSFRIVGNNSNFEKFRGDASSYLRNFRKSLYFADFLKNFAFGLMRMPREREKEVLKYLQSFSEELNKNEQLRVLIYTARSATVSGRIKTANWSSRRALDIMGQNDKLHARMSLYFAASGIVQPDMFDASFMEFNKINRSILDKNDQKLFDAVDALVGRLRSDPIDIAELKSILRSRQQTYPGDEPKMAFTPEKEASILNSNKIAIRAQELFAELEKIMPEQQK